MQTGHCSAPLKEEDNRAVDKVIVIGLGNPILSDDSVGIQVARRFGELLPKAVVSIHVTEAYAGGMRLMDAMTGYDQAIIVDAMVTGDCKPGTVKRFCLGDLVTTRNTWSSHDTNLSMALEWGRSAGLRLPDRVDIFGIEAVDVETFSEQLTADVALAVRPLAEDILRECGCC